MSLLSCAGSVQRLMGRQTANAPRGRVSERISRALASMEKAFSEAGGGRTGLRGSVPRNDRKGKRPTDAKQRALGVGSDLLEGFDEDEDEDDDEDEGDEELDAGLEDEDEEDDAADADEEYDPIAPRGPLENNNYGEVWLPIQARPRRNRKDRATRRLVQENVVKPSSLIYPLFVHDKVSLHVKR